MKEETQRNVSTAIHGLMYVAEQIDLALLGEKRHLDAQKSEREGPFARRLHQIAEIADGGPIEDIEQARTDLQFLWEQIHHLGGGFYSALWDILAPAHVALSELITEQEAKVLLGENADWLRLDTRLGHVHPLILGDDDATFRTYDSTFLGAPTEYHTVRYARHEIEARARTLQELYSSRKKSE